MNYAKMIEILEWVKAGRNSVEFRLMGAFSSPFVCDNIGKFRDSDPYTGYAKVIIKEDIAAIIDHKFGVPDFLGLDEEEDHGDSHPDVLAFRDTMIDNLIAKYTKAQNAAV